MSKVHRLDGVPFPIVKNRPPAPKLPPNPHLVDNLIRPASPGPSSTSTSDSDSSPFCDSSFHPLTRDEKVFRNALLWTDQFSFLTGAASADLEACRIVDVAGLRLRGEGEEGAERRKEVEDLFNYGDRFSLDGLYNGILLEASLHRQWSTYASFCFVPPLPVARVLVDALKALNEVWVSLITSDPAAPRSTLPKFSFPWTVLVLNPRALLPHGKPLTVLENPLLIRGGRSEAQGDTLAGVWERWTLDTGTPECSSLLWDPTHTRTLTIEPASLRERRAELSAWAMILNAEDKLRYAHENYTPPTKEVREYYPVLKEIVRLLFWQPGVETRARTQQSTTLNFDEGPTATADSDSVIDLTADEDGPLSDSEFHAALTTARDPHADADDRLDAVKRVLFGGTGRGYETPLLSTDF
ncbi:unnamed protein product [Cyclocybe aegerita]|uniref:Uncharacterized protein n=1 Tax=Cyclocybe aegerita TaxID=1973307 RepID=A0A8S0WY85_CYCAE|nr:unnamed protein product [Cyclocybe aegerita]